VLEGDSMEKEISGHMKDVLIGYEKFNYGRRG
jgi:hypothetical protein